MKKLILKWLFGDESEIESSVKNHARLYRQMTEMLQNEAVTWHKLRTRADRVMDNISALERSLYGIKMDQQHQKRVRDDIQTLVTAFEEWQRNALVNHEDLGVISGFLTHFAKKNPNLLNDDTEH